MTDPAQARPRGLVSRSLVALAAFLVLVGLGTWQVERLSWKQRLIATIEERLAAPPTRLPTAGDWQRMSAAADEFRRVSLTATLLNDREGLVFTSGSALRGGPGGPGYWVFTPARLADGSLVMVDRGFVPEGRQDPATRADGQTTGSIEIVGVLRWPEARSMFTPADSLAQNLWFVRDPAAIAAAKGVEAAPFYVEQEAPPAPGGLPQVGRLQPNIPNNHLQYALTWYALALALAGVFAAWMRSLGHQRR